MKYIGVHENDPAARGDPPGAKPVTVIACARTAACLAEIDPSIVVPAPAPPPVRAAAAAAAPPPAVDEESSA